MHEVIEYEHSLKGKSSVDLQLNTGALNLPGISQKCKQVNVNCVQVLSGSYLEVMDCSVSSKPDKLWMVKQLNAYFQASTQQSSLGTNSDETQ